MRHRRRRLAKARASKPTYVIGFDYGDPVIDQVVDVLALEMTAVERACHSLLSACSFDTGSFTGAVRTQSLLVLKSAMDPVSFQDMKDAMMAAMHGRPAFSDVLREHLTEWCAARGHTLVGDTTRELIPINELGSSRAVAHVPTKERRTLGVRLLGQLIVELDPYTGSLLNPTGQAALLAEATGLVAELTRLREIEASIKALDGDTDRVRRIPVILDGP